MKTLRIILFILLSSTIVGHAQISEAEYFFDVDPGAGNGTALAMSGNIIDNNYNIATTGLSEGIHKLYIRIMDTDGDWTTYASSVLYINPTHNNSADIVEAEYFFDIDPGTGNGSTLAVSGNQIDASLNISTSGLSGGIHKLYIRIKNSDDLWSTYAMKVFNIMDQGFSNSSLLASAEYFIDIDPGVGNGTSIEFDDAGELDQIFEIQLPNDLPAGDHFIFLRVMIEDNLWSTYALGEYSSTLTIADLEKLGIKIYPNPTSDYIHVKLNEAGNNLDKYMLIDQQGKVVLESEFINEKIDLRYVANGMYLLYLKSDKGSVSHKLIIN